MERSPCALADPQFAGIDVTIREVRFHNLKGATPAEMRASWADLVGQPRPVSTICDVRDRAATLLRDKGYLAAVQVPVQRIENGVVVLEVLYGRVTTVRARGETSGAEAKLTQYLSKLTEDEIFDRKRAERYLLLARDLPGYNVQLTLRPAGTAPGDLVGEVTVIRRPYSVDATVQNLAGRETGRWGGQVRAQAFGLTGMGDVTTLGYYNTLGDWREQRILQAGHQFRPGSEGLIVDGQFTYAWSRPDIGAQAGDPALTARTLFSSLSLTYPLVRRQGHSVYLGGGFDLLNQKVTLITSLTRDRLRIGWLRASAEGVDTKNPAPHWRASGFVELRKGFDMFGASSECRQALCDFVTTVPLSRADADPRATLVRAGGSVELAIGGSLALYVSPRAQLAFAPLAAFEEFTGGNYTIGRGYDPGTISGDSGVGLATELRGPRLRVGHGGARVQPFVFGDIAWAWNKGDGLGADRLSSVGGGVRGNLADRLRLDLTLAKPLERAGLFDRRPGWRALVSLTTRFLPWR
ncbi:MULTISPECIES: ShlB/FhaC/HecB family hemolysin secretion/activation protein [Sphingomonas]|uniref:ShlB/FhaC/HecB family hemolysin secretion/activation protein n=1 Tax=Sphingomonas TaxID=13687 RepID=UPI001F071228|nr:MULTISPECIES: ShlB/FhaC/HecB family hemolysin secretion/activation protein [Sphingomonas]